MTSEQKLADEVERVAKAIYETWSARHSITDTWEDVARLGHSMAMEARTEAVAAIAALRASAEPSASVRDSSSVPTCSDREIVAQANERYPQEHGHWRPAFIVGARWARDHMQAAGTIKDGCLFPDCVCIEAPPCPKYAHRTSMQAAGKAAPQASAESAHLELLKHWQRVADKLQNDLRTHTGFETRASRLAANTFANVRQKTEVALRTEPQPSRIDAADVAGDSRPDRREGGQ
jgi:hypothetical protein